MSPLPLPAPHAGRQEGQSNAEGQEQLSSVLESLWSGGACEGSQSFSIVVQA